MSAAPFIAAVRHEARQNLRLALPLIAAQVSFVAMGTVDTVLAGRLSADALAAVAVGANVWFLPFVFFMGVFTAVSPIVAQRVGAGHAAEHTGLFVRGAILAALALGTVWTVLLEAIADPVLDLLALTREVRALSEGYLRVLAFAGTPFCLCFVLRSAAEAHGLTRIPLAAGLVGLAFNTLAAWTLMYGRAGLPAFGAVGTAIATLAAAWVMVGVYALAFHRSTTLRRLALWRWERPRLDRDMFEIASLGGPIALILTAEAWLFIIGALLMARFGGEVVAAHQIAINFASLSFMVPLSIGLATTVRVAQAAGAGRTDAVALRGRAGMLLGGAFALLSATVMALWPGRIVAVYTATPGVAALAVHFLAFAAVFQLSDCVQATANGALRGLKDTRVPMLITVGAYWLVGLPLSAWLAFETGLGPRGIWVGFIAGLALAATGLSWRFLHHARLAAIVDAG
jgi:MATE family multidrug resistance protein